MKIGIAMMSHETNTFSPVITDLKRFSGGNEKPPSGEIALDIYKERLRVLEDLYQSRNKTKLKLLWELPRELRPVGQ